MSLILAYRLSLYLSLTLASLCLGYAELEFLPEVTGFAVIVGLMLGLAFLLEGRWALSIQAANLVGGVIFALLGIWVSQQFIDKESLIYRLPWPTSLLPYFGPILMVGMAAKLFRPKEIGDHWALHAIAGAMVALACALAGDAIFAVLLSLYLIAGIWSLTLFYFYREAERYPSETPPRSTWLNRRGLPWFGSALGWGLTVLGGGLVIFLLTPRSSGGTWDQTLMDKVIGEVGYNSDQEISLLTTGRLTLSEEVAFQVKVADRQGKPVLNLPAGQRWRGRIATIYERGTWKKWTWGLDQPKPALRQSDKVQNEVQRTMRMRDQRPGFGGKNLRLNVDFKLPQFPGPERIFDFNLATERSLNNPVLADPVYWEPRGLAPVASVLPWGEKRPWDQNPDGSFAPPPIPEARAKYRQVNLARADPNRGRSIHIHHAADRYALTGDTETAITEFTETILERLVANGSLPAATLERDRHGFVAPQYREAIGLALERYFLYSGEFGYSLDLQRQDTSVDPIVDFLENVRTGHCNRFATALTLMLRSQGIPARMILGFRGAEHQGDGNYCIRESFAHAWLEILVPDRDRVNESLWYWRTLDPTPSETLEIGQANVSWWSMARHAGANLFEDFIIGYDADRQRDTTAHLWQPLLESWERFRSDLAAGRSRALAILLAFAAGIAGLVGLERWRRRWRKRRRDAVAAATPRAEATPILVAFQERLQRILAAYGWQPAQGQTAAAFAQNLKPALSERLTPPQLAEVPTWITLWYYRVRFGELPLPPEVEQDLAHRLDALEHALEASAAS